VLDELATLGMSTLPLDVTNAESIRACHESVKKITGGRLDFLINNACAPFPGPFFSHHFSILMPSQRRPLHRASPRRQPR
jgi:NAD(P)-dependent dehydrogenase (short-subunit alcohol dehydrogenase family)